MIYFLFIIVFLFGFCNYLQERKDLGILPFFFFITNGFYLLSNESSPVKYYDVAIVYMFLIFFLRLLKKKTSFFKPKIGIFKFILLIIAYITAIFIKTVINNEELPTFALAIYRLYLPFLSFFLVQELSNKEIQRLINWIITIVSVMTILFVVQPILGVKLLNHADITNELGIPRYRNIPYLTYFLLLYTTVKRSKSIILLLVCIVAVILTQHRGVMIAYALCMIVYLLMNKKIGSIVQYSFMGLIVLSLAGDVVFNRLRGESGGGSTIEDIENVIKFDYSSVIINGITDEDSRGTLSFRVLLFMERFQFLLQNPNKALFGIGTRHEDSPNTKDFNFILGTTKNDSDHEIAQINSGDLVWMNPLLLFGIVGLVLFVSFSVYTFKYLYCYRNISDITMSAFLFYLMLILISFKNNHLFGNEQLFFIYVVAMYIQYNRKCIDKAYK